GADIIERTVAQWYRQGQSFSEQVHHALVRRIASGQEFARQQKCLASCPLNDIALCQGVEVDAFAFLQRQRIGDAVPDVSICLCKVGRTFCRHLKGNKTRRRAVWYEGNGQERCMRG